MNARSIPTVCLGLALLLAAPACAQDQTAGSGAEDDPFVLDVDELLKQGFGLIVAAEDSIPFADGTADTVLITAPRVTVAEVVRRIGERMERESLAMGRHAYTTRTNVVMRKHGEVKEGRPVEIKVLEQADRVTESEGAIQIATLWKRERKLSDGEVVDEKVDDEVSADWQAVEEAAEQGMNVPFSLLTGDAYDYEIQERALIGEHLIYRVGFAPKTGFRAEPTGTVWIDYGEYVIRRMEGRVDAPFTMPPILKGIPEFRLRQEQVDGWWVPVEIYLRVELRRLLPGIPAEIELFWRSEDHEFENSGGEVAR